MKRLLALPLLVLLLACGGTETPERRPGADVTHGGAVVLVETAPVERGAILPRLTAAGSLVARRESRIGAEVPGRIEQVSVSVGDRVEQGAPLFHIESGSYELALGQAEAGLELATAERRQIDADLARAEVLHGKDIVSAQELGRLRTRLAVARARERQSTQQVEIARRDLAGTVVRAPFAGSISERLVDEGTMAQSQPQTIVVVLQETAALEARVSLAETQLALVRAGDPAEIFIESLPDPIPAEVTAVSDAIDPATRTYLVRMAVPNPERKLKAGLFVRAEIVPSAKDDVLLVPREAVRTEDGETRVLVVRDGEAVPVTIRLGLVGGEQVEVLRGLEVGELVVVGAAARRIAPGMKVRTEAAALAARS
jgi:RND family efflux transporter MFP subunit